MVAWNVRPKIVLRYLGDVMVVSYWCLWVVIGCFWDDWCCETFAGSHWASGMSWVCLGHLLRCLECAMGVPWYCIEIVMDCLDSLGVLL